MRIPLTVGYLADDLRIMANFLLRCDKPHIFMPLTAIVDTGSPTTLLGSLDIEKMRISPIQINKLEGRNKPIAIGGGQVITRIIEKAKLRFGEFLEVEMPIDFPIKGGSPQPTLLGVDFMLKTGAKLFFDPTNRKAYFEIED